MKTERNTLFTCTELPEKEKRNLAIFELIRKRGLISKPEISKITGINIVSVSNYIENYISKHLVSERESEVSSGGRKPELVELNKKDRFVIGVDAASGTICANLANLEAKSIASTTMPRTGPDDAQGASASIISSIENVIKKAAIDPSLIGGIGIAVADSNLIAAGETVSKRFGAEVFMGGPALCAAFGEKWLNKESDSDDILYIYSDLGRGIAVKGSKCFGAAGVCGEIKMSEENGRSDSDDGLEEEAGYLRPWSPVFGAVAAARAEVLKGVGTKIVDAASGRIENITLETIIEAAGQGDRVASDILKGIGMNLGVRISYLINAFNPRVVIVGGGIEKARDLILDPVRSMVKRFAFARYSGRVKILPGSLGGDAVCLGAASLAVREVFLRA